MSILLQNLDENRQMLGELEGIDILLQQLAVSPNPSFSETRLCLTDLLIPHREAIFAMTNGWFLF